MKLSTSCIIFSMASLVLALPQTKHLLPLRQTASRSIRDNKFTSQALSSAVNKSDSAFVSRIASSAHHGSRKKMVHLARDYNDNYGDGNDNAADLTVGTDSSDYALESRSNMKVSSKMHKRHMSVNKVARAPASSPTATAYRPGYVTEETVETKPHHTNRRPKRPRDGAADTSPTPAPTGPSSKDTTVHINNELDFSLLLPRTPNERISDSENDAVAYCRESGCDRTMPDDFITGAAVQHADDGSFIQITGCFDASKFPFADGDDGGQLDVRYPNGAQCAFGGYGASFIEQIEPSQGRFCMRCCATENDQVNCNSHMDEAGCPATIPGQYSFADVSCD